MPTEKPMQARSLSDTRFRSRQPIRNIASRRARFVARIEAMPDAPERWELLFAVLEQQLDLNRDALDRGIGTILEIPPERIALFTKARGAA
jgi:hypothetical protein